MFYRSVSQAAPQAFRSPIACDSGSSCCHRNILSKGIQASELSQEGRIEAYHHGSRLQWDVCSQVCRDEQRASPFMDDRIHFLANTEQEE
jgi:hypothetical protein